MRGGPSLRSLTLVAIRYTKTGLSKRVLTVLQSTRTVALYSICARAIPQLLLWLVTGNQGDVIMRPPRYTQELCNTPQLEHPATNMEILVVNREGQFQAVSLHEAQILCQQEGYRLATPAEQNQYEQAQRNKSDLRE